jgi:hypothetical protein
MMDRSSTDNSGQMGRDMSGQIREHMMVHAQGQGSMNGVEGEHVGTVDYVEGDNIILTKNDSPDGMHHSISMSFVDRVEGNTVFLNVDAETIQQEWETVDASDRDNDRDSMSGMNR